MGKYGFLTFTGFLYFTGFLGFTGFYWFSGLNWFSGFYWVFSFNWFILERNIFNIARIHCTYKYHIINCMSNTDWSACAGHLREKIEGVKGIRSNCSLATLNLPPSLCLASTGQRKGGGFNEPFEQFPRSLFIMVPVNFTLCTRIYTSLTLTQPKTAGVSVVYNFAIESEPRQPTLHSSSLFGMQDLRRCCWSWGYFSRPSPCPTWRFLRHRGTKKSTLNLWSKYHWMTSVWTWSQRCH